MDFQSLKVSIDSYIQSQQWGEAILLLQDCQQASPDNVEVLSKLASIYHQQSDYANALTYYHRLYDLLPQNPICAYNLSIVYKLLEQWPETIEFAEQAIVKNPDFYECYHHLAEVHYELSSSAHAERLWLQAIQIDPNRCEAKMGLAILYREQHDNVKSRHVLHDILLLLPNHVAALNTLAMLDIECLDYEQAETHLNFALTNAPEDLPVLCNTLVLYLLSNNLERLKHYAERVISLYPTTGIGQFYLAHYFKKNKQSEKAFQYFSEAMKCDKADENYVTDYIAAACDIGKYYKVDYVFQQVYAQLNTCKVTLQLLQAYSEQLDFEKVALLSTKLASLDSDETQGLEPFIVMVHSTDNDFHKRVAKAFVDYKCHGIVAFPHKRIRHAPPYRIGYLSPDFNNHPVGLLNLDLIKSHRTDKFQPILFSTTFKRDERTELFQRYATEFHDCTCLSPKQIAQFIRDKDIDILIDLCGHTGQSRIEIMAFCPAPIQCQFSGYPATLGADFIDYYVTTEVGAPDSIQDAFVETIIHLPESETSLASLQSPSCALSRADFGLTNEDFVYACFNNISRIDEAAFSAWMAILSETENSILWLQYAHPSQQHYIIHRAKSFGIAKERLLISQKQVLSETWTNLLANLVLDTFTIAGGTAGILHAYAGVPTLTKIGNTPQSRIGATTLRSVGLDELIVESTEDYVSKAVSLYYNRQKLIAYQEQLALVKKTSSLFNPNRFIQHIEAAYEGMLRQERQKY